MPLESLYQDKILELARFARLLKPINDFSSTFTVRNPICGDMVTINLLINSSGIIQSYGHIVKGCALCEASAGLISKNAVGASINNSLNLVNLTSKWLNKNTEELSFKELKYFAPVREYKNRHKCVLLSFEAFVKACKKN
tara:strand:- start:31 stop:450 length:420 start_codon:yes stop_codon:yes gene_type:complete